MVIGTKDAACPRLNLAGSVKTKDKNLCECAGCCSATRESRFSASDLKLILTPCPFEPLLLVVHPFIAGRFIYLQGRLTALPLFTWSLQCAGAAVILNHITLANWSQHQIFATLQYLTFLLTGHSAHSAPGAVLILP